MKTTMKIGDKHDLVYWQNIGIARLYDRSSMYVAHIQFFIQQIMSVHALLRVDKEQIDSNNN